MPWTYTDRRDTLPGEPYQPPVRFQTGGFTRFRGLSFPLCPKKVFADKGGFSLLLPPDAPLV